MERDLKIEVFVQNANDPSDIGTAFGDWLKMHGDAPDFLALHQDTDTLDLALATRAAECNAMHGATSCLGVMGQDGASLVGGVGAFGIWDSDGDYGTAMAPLEQDAEAAARAATQDAIAKADRQGEAPDIIWLSSSPGAEEAVLRGVESVVGSNVPIFGGSAADNSVSGEWKVFTATDSASAGVVVSVLFPSKPISFAYHNGYAPNGKSGQITKSDGRRLIEIDHRPAAEVYREWTKHDLIPEDVEETTSILSASTLAPLGRYLDSVGGVPYYLLAHPAEVTPENELLLFADVRDGERLTLMNGSTNALTERAGKVAALAAQTGGIDPSEAAGALIVYCGGCMLSVRDHIDDVTTGINAALPGVPYLGVFTFGEQGEVLDGRNRHGNLMISAIIFGS